MNTKVRAQIPAPKRKGSLSIETMNQMVDLYNAAEWALLETTARDVTNRYPEHVFGWKALGKALLQSGKLGEAITPLARASKIAPNDADAFIDLANTLQTLGRLEEAEKNFRLALKIKPGSAPLHDTLGALLCSLGRFEDAEKEFRLALRSDPRYVQAHINLAHAAASLGVHRWGEAEASYRQALELAPEFAEVHRRLGDLLAKISSRSSEAIVFLEKAIELNPLDAGSIVTLGNVLMAQERFDESNALFRRAQQIQPLINWPAKQPTPAFSVLLLDAPGAGSTPVNYLAGRSAYECNFVAVLPDADYDMDLLRSKANVVFNMIADADNGAEVLPLALELADKLGRPIVNHPRKIMATDRESIAAKLAGIPLCRIPKTVRIPAEIAAAGWQRHIDGFAMPLLIRCAGTHGGDDFEKVEDIGGIEAFVAGHPDATFYLSEFVDYRSADNLYRKYRVICIDGGIQPYHLAIHDHWMVHHFRTDMANQEWMRKEEEAFLDCMDGVFNQAHQDALRQIGKATGLDYCGIDCALDRDGNIVVFETNATMLVHDEKDPLFMYKNPYIAKIKLAFDAMLAKMALGEN